MSSGRQFSPCLLFKEVARLLLLTKVHGVVLGSISHQRNCCQPTLGLWELNVGAYFQEYLTRAHREFREIVAAWSNHMWVLNIAEELWGGNQFTLCL